MLLYLDTVQSPTIRSDAENEVMLVYSDTIAALPLAPLILTKNYDRKFGHNPRVIQFFRL